MSETPPTPTQPEAVERLRQAKRQARALVMPLDGVRGVGIGNGTIRVYIRDRTVAAALPPDIDGVPVEPVVVGQISAY